MAEPKDEKKTGIPKIRPISAPMDVPVFNIVIHVSRQEGQVRARVANLPDLDFTAGSEPLALKQALVSRIQPLRSDAAAISLV